MATPHVPSRASLAAILCLVILLASASASASAHNTDDRSPLAECSKTCVAENCDSIGMKYGKYCGAGYWGCPGEKPCDDLDECCRIHDDCVDKDGMMNVKCHKKFKRCIRRVMKSGKTGFSKECPYGTVVPVMMHGMDFGILLSLIGNPKQ